MGKNLKGKELGVGFRQRQGGLYEARGIIDGKEVRLTNKNFSALKKEFNTLKKELNKGNTLLLTQYTLNQWFEQWFKVYKSVQLKETSKLVLKSKYYRIFGKYIGQLNIKQISNLDIQNCIHEYIEQGKSITELKSACDNLTECLECAKENKLIYNNPCKIIKIQKSVTKKNDKDKYLTENEINEFLLISKEYSWYYELFYILLNTGMRVSEICGLKWQDIDFKNKCINIERQLVCQYYQGKNMYFETPKSQQGYRTIPFINNVENILKQQFKKVSERKLLLGEQWRNTNDEYKDLIFFSTMGSPLSKDTITRAIQAMVQRINKTRSEDNKFKKIHPHMFRHTFAVRCYENGVKPKVVQSILGHSDISTTMNIYTHLSNDSLVNEIQKINKGSSNF